MPKLTEQEKREVADYLREDIDLPEKYRFLLFGEKREVELVWNGKTNEVTNVVLPFQTIEQVDEPRTEAIKPGQISMFDGRGRQTAGWTNKLIWGDNKLILSSLKNGPMRKEIEDNGGIKLIYIDPPFDVGADFSMQIEIGDETLTKEPSVLEQIAYSDTWGKGADSFMAMLYERLVLMRDLLAPDGSLYVHCDWRVNSLLRLALDEIFGKDHFLNEIIWHYQAGTAPAKGFAKKHDNILAYVRNPSSNVFNQVRLLVKDESIYPHIDEAGRKYRMSGNNNATRYYADEGRKADDVWTWLDRKENNVVQVFHALPEHLGYPTQKPQKLLERIISASSNEQDLVADFFCGSGTTLAVAERLNRKWIGTDLGKFAIHTTRKRMLGIQRQLKEEGKPYRAFEILNLGRYERRHFVAVDADLREEEKRKQIARKEREFIGLILRAYKAEKAEGFTYFQGKKAGRLVHVGPADQPVAQDTLTAILEECSQRNITRADVLGFEFEMSLFPHAQEIAKAKGIDLQPKCIPAEVFDKRAVERGQVAFYDLAYVEAKPIVKGNHLSIQLTNFSVSYSQDNLADLDTALKPGAGKVMVDKGQIVKVTKSKAGSIERELLTKSWTDWIDYWSVDFDFESKKEIIRELIDDSIPGVAHYEDKWTGNYIFENEWQSFRTKRHRKLELTSAPQQLPSGKHRVAIKVVDIFGTDTMTVLTVTI